jgi:hypothetical protein
MGYGMIQTNGHRQMAQFTRTYLLQNKNFKVSSNLCVFHMNDFPDDDRRPKHLANVIVNKGHCSSIEHTADALFKVVHIPCS